MKSRYITLNPYGSSGILDGFAASSGDSQLQDPCSASEHHGAGEGGDVAVRGGHRRGLQRTRTGRDLVNLGAVGMFPPCNCVVDDVRSMSNVENT